MIVYKILNKNTNKIYIGMTERSLIERWKSHCGDAFSNNSQTYFHRSIRKHGVNAFIKRILFRGKCKAELIKMELHFIAKYDSMNPKIGYNGTVGGTGGKPNKEVRMKISKKLKGRSMPWLQTEEVFAKISKANTGRKCKESTKQKLREAHIGKKFSEEAKAKMSASGKTKVFTTEHKLNISKALKGRKQTQAWIFKRSVALKGFKHSDETKEKISKATQGRVPWNKGKRKNSLGEYV